jgi:nitrogen fixation NifU-like protein
VSVALYSDVIRERFRHPRFRGTLPDPDATFEDVNPLCGDRIRVECRLADGKIAEARFTGDSCAIAAASADVLIELMVGQPAERAHTLGVGDLLEHLEADIRPSRMKCVTLPLSVLQGALDRKEVAR